MTGLSPVAMGGKGSGRKSTPEDQALREELQRYGYGVPQEQVDRAKVTGGRAIRKINKARRKRGK